MDRERPDPAVTARDAGAGLTDAQRRIVEWNEGPLVVIAGAGTGKTRVIVARVAHLLRTKGAGDEIPPELADDHDPFHGPLPPEQVLVLTYNVRAAKELKDRLELALGAAAASRLPVSNFHSFCHRILADNAAEAGLKPNPDVLDGIGQVLLLHDIRPDLPLLYHAGGSNPNYWLDQFVGFINRAKDELVTPDVFDTFVEGERAAFEARFGPYGIALDRVMAQGILGATKDVRGAYADFRRKERADERGEDVGTVDFVKVEKVAGREARRTLSGTGQALRRNQFTPDQLPDIDHLADTYVADGAALEVMRLGELALVYRAYQAELERRGALDFGEQIAAATQLFKHRPNVLRRYQRQYRYILVDEFQDANIAQIELIELLGRTPDRPDNVMVVGDDDQSIYRFRGASFAAFAEFDRRFASPPAHDPHGPTPPRPTRMRIEENFRSFAPVLTVANRLIAANLARYEPDKRLVATRGTGESVEVIVCASPEDEATAIVDVIKAQVGRPWSDIAVLYRKHKHREAIVARLRDEGIPYTVVGGLSLFETAEIRDLEQGLRAIADPTQDVALVRMMSAGPWRLDAIEILQVARMARYNRRRIAEVVREIVDSGKIEVDRVDGGAAAMEAGDGAEDAEDGSGGGLALQPQATDLGAEDPHPNRHPARKAERVEVAAVTRAKLRRLVGILDELTPMTWRDGPLTVLERYLERTSLVLDLVALDTLESKRMVANIASFLRFGADWQQEHPVGSLAGFVDYLDAYQTAGGDLPTSVELTQDIDGVRLMTLYQAKGLEFPVVFVPQLLRDEWPAREYGSGLFPKDLLREAIPAGDMHTEEERRLLYVALTRARDRLIVTTHGGPAAKKEPSPFVEELLAGAGDEVRKVDRVGERTAGEPAPPSDPLAELRRIMPIPTAREGRLTLRLQAVELLGLIEGTSATDPETAAARAFLASELAALGEAMAEGTDSARARGLDPLSLRAVALDTGAGANLLDVLPLPSSFSYSQFDTYERCPLQYAFGHVYRIPSSRTVAAFSFGTSAHAAFEAFTRDRRERLARGEAPPDRDDLERIFRAEWPAGKLGDQTTEETYQRRVGTLLDNFYDGELKGLGEALHEELPFALTIAPDDGSPAFVIGGVIDRIDRLPDGGIEVVDYKTGRIQSQKDVTESLQLSIYALACRDRLGLGTPERVTYYFTEAATRRSTTRSEDQLDLARQDLAARAARIRSGDFAADPAPGKCWRCDYAPMCPARAR